MPRLTSGDVGKRIIYFSIPILIGNIFQQLYQVVDSIIVGRYVGKDALAATGASFPIIFLLVSLVIGVSIGSSTVVGQYYGAKNKENVRKAIDSTYIFLFFASIVICLTGIVLSKPILRLIQLPESLIPDAAIYLQIYLLSMFFMFIFNGTCAILRGIGDSKTPLKFLVVSAIMNAVLDMIFVVWFGWGIVGAAWATVISSAFVTIAMILYLNRVNEVVKLQVKRLKYDGSILKKIVSIGLPAGVQQSFVAMGMLALNALVNKYGHETIAAYTSVGRLESLATIASLNFGVGLTAFVAQNIGANRMDRVRQGTRFTILFSGGIALAFSLILTLFGSTVMRLFSSDPEVIAIGHEYLIYTAPCYFLFSVMTAYGGVMRGAGDMVISMIITLLSMWLIRIPIAYALSPSLDRVGIWISVGAGWAIGALANYIYFRSGRWLKVKLIER